MHKRYTPAAWDAEQLDSSSPLLSEEPYFDETVNAWVLSRFDDVAAAFRSPALWQAGPRSTLPDAEPDEKARLKMRAEAVEELSSAALDKWRTEVTEAARVVLDSLPVEAPVDLVAEYARPVCLTMAAAVTGISAEDAAALAEQAEQVSEGAAEPLDQALARRAAAVDQILGKCFPPGPASLRGPGFVALSQTLCHLLGRCWFALLQHPAEWGRLHRDPAQIGSAVEELLRYAGLTRMLFRLAGADVEINGAKIRKGERVILRLIAANRDAAVFGDSDALDFAAHRTRHVALGLGKHACVGAPLLRLAIGATTRLLVERFAGAALTGRVEWRGGSGFRFPRSLPVALRRN